MRRMPSLGPPPRKSAAPKVFLAALVAGSAAGGYWYLKRPTTPSLTLPPVLAPLAQNALPSPGAPLGAPTEPGAPTVAQTPTLAPAPVPEDPVKKAGLSRVQIVVDGAIERSMVAELGDALGQALAQVTVRALVWWVDVPGDLRKGDHLDVLFEERPNEEPRIHSIRFESGKLAKTFSAYRFQPKGEPFARYYQANGDELEMRLNHSPLDDYEQITSLIKDGRRHKGVDFKTPVGTPLKAPFAGTLTRKNWNWRSNGNCLELTESNGRRKALFLHLAELPSTVQVGQRVSVGEVIGKTGNTGRSFAPHLHYQLMIGEKKVLDPFVEHTTYRRTLAAAEKPALDTELARLDTLMGPSAVAKTQ